MLLTRACSGSSNSINDFEKKPILKTSDSRGIPSRLSGINWHGFDETFSMPTTLKYRNYQSVLDQMKQLKFNVIRIPFSQTIFKGIIASEEFVNFTLNPELKGLTSLQCLDKIIHYCGQIGLGVLLSRLTESMGTVGSDGLWDVSGGYSHLSDQFLLDWVSLASRYLHTAVIGMELWHASVPSSSSEWDLAAVRIGNAILDVSPDLLIFVERRPEDIWSRNAGIDNKEELMHLSIPNRLFYSIRHFPAEWYLNSPAVERASSSMGRNLRGGSTATEVISTPVVLMAMGSSHIPSNVVDILNNNKKGPKSVSKTMVNYNKEQPATVGLSWFIDAIDRDEGETGGIFSADWKTVDEAKLPSSLQSLFGSPLLPLQDRSLEYNPYFSNTDKTMFHYRTFT